MGATSVTGKGLGAAGAQKGPGNKRNFWVPQVNPHVVAAGTATLAAGTGTVTFPTALAESEANYVVMVTPEAACNVSFFVTKADVAGAFASFDIDESGAAYDGDVMWSVMKAGFGLDVAR